MHYCGVVCLFEVSFYDEAYINHKERGEMSMEKNRIRKTAAGRNTRMTYARQKEVLDMPNLGKVQKHQVRH